VKNLPQNFLAFAILFGLPPFNAAATTHYVDMNSTNATPPYTNWATAAVDIQDAINAATAGDEIVVTNGSYSAVTVGEPLDIRSVNGAQFTVIYGEDTRCADLNYVGTLSGFTLTGGYVQGSDETDGGAGARLGTLNNCVLISNSVSIYSNGHATPDPYTFTAYGGGAYDCTLNNCTLIGNSASAYIYDVYGYGIQSCYARGGGAYHCVLINCTLIGNTVTAFAGCLSSCTGDFAYTGDGGAEDCTLNNCISFGAKSFVNGFGHCNDCCFPGHLDGDNWCGDPLFVNYAGGNFRLQSNSPCINTGNNSYATNATDLDGNPRIVGGTVDIGAYEYQSLSLIRFNVVSNQAAFAITGQSNQVVIVQTSIDLLNWSPLATNTLNGHPFPFSDPTPASLPQRFYRAQAH
jgi:hypothetical protein